MNISPRFTCSPEGVFELRSQISKNAPQEYLDKVLGAVAENEDYTLVSENNEYKVSTNFIEQLPNVEFPSQDASKKMKEIVDFLEPFIYFDYDDKRDAVLTLDWWGERGFTGIVYPQLQKWMNADLFTEDVAVSIFEQMCLPYGSKEYDRMKKRYDYKSYSNGISAGDGGMSVNIALVKDEFGITKFDENEGDPRYVQGDVNWTWPSLSTIGNCACLGVDGSKRSRLLLHDANARLYEVQPHNIDGYAQSLSLAIGLGRLAYEASKYTGEEDIFEGVEWKETR